jgi:histidine triad (HIT) family protein
MPTESSDCVFCRIAAGTIPATIVRETDQVLAFRDLSPQAPVHVLVISREHHRDVAELARQDPGTLSEMIAVAAQIAEESCGGQYRLVANTGTDAGQSVFHVHLHVLGGCVLEHSAG